MSYPESASFHLLAPFYDAVMRDVPYQHWVKYLRKILALRKSIPQSVLDLACGTGTVSQILAADGMRVTGVDISPEMIRVAREKKSKKKFQIRFEVQDAAEINLDEQYDLCICLFDSLNYILEPDRLALAIGRVYDHLNPGGLFIFDVNTEYALKNSFFNQNNLDCSDKLRYVWRSEYDAETRLCEVAMRFFHREKNGIDSELRETHRQRAYSEQDLRTMLDDAGFADIVTYDAYTLISVQERTDRMFFVAARPQDL